MVLEGNASTVKPELTASLYTDPKLLDVAGAIAALPALSTPVDATWPSAKDVNAAHPRRRVGS